ncbi:hypothetical protein A9Q81_06195 [Gammaproteobacteria bacterium 42_54_T18]|nr:hypothetical protein A9Q81_06195 [Gammaproteobacteria bacterium 42_54_T18]
MYDRIEKNYNSENDIHSVFEKYIDIKLPKIITLKLVFNYFNNDWHFLIGKAYIDEQPASSNLIYPDLVLLTMTAEVPSFEEFITTLQSEGISYSDKYPVVKPENLSWKERLIPKTHSIKQPIRSFETRIVENSNCFQDKKLFAYKQPYSNSSIKLVRDFIGMESFQSSSDSRIGKFVIEVLDNRGSLLLDNNCLQFTSSEPAYMTGELQYLDRSEVISCDDGSSIDVDLNEIKNIDIFLLNQQSEVLDFITTSHYEFFFPLINKESESELVKLIQAGENDRVEFKQFIGFDNSKKKEIDKTVCAFSNNAGGILFIGVNDDGIITGLESGDFGKQFKNNIEEYVDTITKYLKERLSINSCFNVLYQTVCGEQIVVVEVTTANGCNQIIADKIVYIRKGASSMQATPEEINNLCADQKSSNNECFP